jgi:hypothetical protein
MTRGLSGLELEVPCHEKTSRPTVASVAQDQAARNVCAVKG